jgi:hypothetical protein
MLHISVFGKVVLNLDFCAPHGVPILVFKNGTDAHDVSIQHINKLRLEFLQISQINIHHFNKPRLVSKLNFFQTFFDFFSRNFKRRGDGNHDDRHDDDRHHDDEEV